MTFLSDTETSDANLRVVAIGCGRVFERYHLPAIRATAGVKLVGACEIDPERRAWAQTALGDAARFDSFDALLAAVPADAALICTPPATHAELIGRAMERALHVLVEKPMALTSAEVRCIRETESAVADRVVRVGFNRRYRAEYQALRQRVTDGGGVRHVSFRFVADVSRWRADSAAPSTAESVLHDAASHGVDLIAHVAGRRIERARAESFPRGSSCLVRADFELEGGVTGEVTAGHGTSYEEQLAVTARDGGRWEADLSGQSITARCAIALKAAWRKARGRSSPTDESFRGQWAGFVGACGGERDGDGADAAAGAEAVAAIEACIESLSRDGTWCEAR